VNVTVEHCAIVLHFGTCPISAFGLFVPRAHQQNRRLQRIGIELARLDGRHRSALKGERFRAAGRELGVVRRLRIAQVAFGLHMRLHEGGDPFADAVRAEEIGADALVIARAHVRHRRQTLQTADQMTDIVQKRSEDDVFIEAGARGHIGGLQGVLFL